MSFFQAVFALWSCNILGCQFNLGLRLYAPQVSMYFWHYADNRHHNTRIKILLEKQWNGYMLACIRVTILSISWRNAVTLASATSLSFFNCSASDFIGSNCTNNGRTFDMQRILQKDCIFVLDWYLPDLQVRHSFTAFTDCKLFNTNWISIRFSNVQQLPLRPRNVRIKVND